MEIVNLPQDLRSPLEFVEQSGSLQAKNLVVRDTASGQHYRVTPEIVKGWPKRHMSSPAGSSVIIALKRSTMVAIHLGTGEVYTTAAPPTGLSL